MRPRTQGALLLLLAFALGALAGALAYGAYQARWGSPGPRKAGFTLDQLDRELGLSGSQRRQVEVILGETGQEFARLREEVGPRFRDIRARSRARIREVLEPAQREKFDALAARVDERFRRRRGGAGSR